MITSSRSSIGALVLAAGFLARIAVRALTPTRTSRNHRGRFQFLAILRKTSSVTV
jgi:hypothetical protein